MRFRNRIEIAFDAGHRLLNYDGKCASPHGHSFRAELILEGEDLDARGLVLDFGDIKRSMKGWIDDHWDHGFLVNSDDSLLLAALRTIPEAKIYCFHEINPSAEAMARELFAIAENCLGPRLSAIRVWESTTQYAEFGR